MIYLDYAANPLVEKEVLDAYYDATLKYFANPNSEHKLGLQVKERLAQSTSNIARNLNIKPDEIIYTSGATESNNLAIKGVCEKYKEKGKHVILSSLEHSSIIASASKMLDYGFEIDIVNVNNEGLVDIDELKSLIREETILVSICTIDSEVGIRQPIEEIGEMLKKYPNVIFHTDATQAIGKCEINLENIDLVTLTPHKFYGLNGMGLLIRKENVSLEPQMNGGKSTTVYRSGTPVIADVIATDKALDIALKKQSERLKLVEKYNEEIVTFLKKYSNIVINNTDRSIPHVINFSIRGITSSEVIKALEEKEVYISSKTACCNKETPSKIIYALTKDEELATSSLRLSICHLTKEQELKEFYGIFDSIYKELNNGSI